MKQNMRVYVPYVDFCGRMVLVKKDRELLITRKSLRGPQS